MVRIFLLFCALFCVSCGSKHRTPPANVKVVELHGCNETDFKIGMNIVINKVSYGPGSLGPDGCKVMMTPIEVDRDFLVYVRILNEEGDYEYCLAKVSHVDWADVIDIAKKFKIIYIEPSGVRLEIYDSIHTEAKPIKIITDFEMIPWSGPMMYGRHDHSGQL